MVFEIVMVLAVVSAVFFLMKVTRTDAPDQEPGPADDAEH